MDVYWYQPWVAWSVLLMAEVTLPMVHDAPSLIDEAPLEKGTTNPLLQQLSFVCVLLTD